MHMHGQKCTHADIMHACILCRAEEKASPIYIHTSIHRYIHTHNMHTCITSWDDGADEKRAGSIYPEHDAYSAYARHRLRTVYMQSKSYIHIYKVSTRNMMPIPHMLGTDSELYTYKQSHTYISTPGWNKVCAQNRAPRPHMRGTDSELGIQFMYTCIYTRYMHAHTCTQRLRRISKLRSTLNWPVVDT
jgi:hypothetical protein